MTQMMGTNVIIPEDIRKMHQLAVKFQVIVSVVVNLLNYYQECRCEIIYTFIVD